MAGVIKRLAGPAYLSSPGAANIYNPSANTYAVVRHLHVANTDTVTRTFTLYVGLTGGSAGGTEIAKTIALAAGGTWDEYATMRLDTADFLTGLADAASKVTITVEGDLYAL